ncbi:hypothetical protein XENTR_v10017211 [Xenopus tropicalis]|nr:hypothetical protein XENTR_v10017211 [Xenopus tropicalis]
MTKKKGGRHNHIWLLDRYWLFSFICRTPCNSINITIQSRHSSTTKGLCPPTKWRPHTPYVTGSCYLSSSRFYSSGAHVPSLFQSGTSLSMAARTRETGNTATVAETAVKQVQIDGMVVLKIIKHYQEEGHGSEVVQGVLLGLVVDDRLEITNCFPFPQHTEDDVDFDEVQYQMEMMRSLRHVNIDHLHVGWYQSTFYGTFVSRALLDSQFSYQHAIEESVVLIYDPIKTGQGSLSLKAYRLTPKLMEVCKEKDFSAEGNHLEKSLQLLMDRVDELSQDIVKYNTYLRNISKQQQQKHQYTQRRQQENLQRQSRGETSLPEEDVNKLFKPPVPPSRMDSLLIAGQINTYIQHIKEFTSQNLGKLFMAEAMQDPTI